MPPPNIFRNHRARLMNDFEPTRTLFVGMVMPWIRIRALVLGERLNTYEPIGAPRPFDKHNDTESNGLHNSANDLPV